MERDEKPVKDNQNISSQTKPIKIPLEIPEIKEENLKLKRKIERHKKRLDQANKKIVDLIKEKAALTQKVSEYEETNKKPIYKNWESQKEITSKIQTAQNQGQRQYLTSKSPFLMENDSKDRGYSKENLNKNRGQISRKDEILLEEINRNINSGMSFYKI